MSDIKKILIVSHAFYSEISPRSFRATELVKEFCRSGHEVTVISHDREGLDAFSKLHGFKFIDMGGLTWKPIEIKGKGVFLLARRILNRVLTYFFEYPFIQLIPLTRKALKNQNGYDVMISIAFPFPTHWAVASVRSAANPIAKVWIADCGDPYMGQENDTVTPPFYFGWIEKWFCRKADFITIPTINSINGYYEEFHPKLKVIPQGFRFEDIQLSKETPDDQKVVFGYAGMFIPGRRDPSEFLQYLNSLADSIPFEFHVYTNTPHLVTHYANQSQGRIKIFDFIPREKLLFELSKMNFVVNFENQGKTQTPSKLIDYLIIEKPVLSIKFGQLMPNVVDEFLNGKYQNRMALPDKAVYQIETIANQFLELLQDK
jgi:hypothetical protein